jgi:hypothetical protein
MMSDVMDVMASRVARAVFRRDWCPKSAPLPDLQREFSHGSIRRMSLGPLGIVHKDMYLSESSESTRHHFTQFGRLGNIARNAHRDATPILELAVAFP